MSRDFWSFELPSFNDSFFFPKISNSPFNVYGEPSLVWKTRDRREKLSEIYDLQRVFFLAYMRYRRPFSVQGHFGVIRCTCDFSENTIFKRLLLIQIAAEIYQTRPESSYRWTSQNYFLGFLNFANWHFNDFFFVNLGPNRWKIKMLLVLQVPAESFQNFPEFSSQWPSPNYTGEF